MSEQRRSGLLSAGLTSVGLTGATLVLNVGTGVLLARGLAADGRGEASAAIVATQVLGLIGALGGRHALAYFLARGEVDRRSMTATVLAMLLPFAAVVVVACELVLPLVFAAQRDAALDVARWFALSTAFITWAEFSAGLLLGNERYGTFNLARFFQPVVLAIGYVGLSAAGEFTLGSALAVNAASTAIVPCVGLVVAVRDNGLAAPRLRYVGLLLSYGTRSNLATIAAMTNGRLDLLIMPAVLAATSVGVYAVSVSVTSIVVATTGALNFLVLPAAVKRGDQGPRTVVLAACGSLALGLALAVPLALATPFLVPAMYGSAFEDSVTPALLLLPGVVFFAAAGVLTAGIASQARPGLSSVPAFVGVVVTVTGLAAFLEDGGPQAAALVSTTSYLVTFAVALVLFKRVTGLTWTTVLRHAGELADLVRSRLRGLRPLTTRR